MKRRHGHWITPRWATWAALSCALSGVAGALPSSAWISQVGHVRQTRNNCGPASLIAAMQTYGLSANQAELARRLKPSPTGYMATNVIEPYLNSVGLDTTYYQQGQLDHLKRLVANGIPVIVLQYLDRPGGIVHYRTVRGYDDRSGVIWFSDSMYGAATYLSYSDFDRLWNVYSRSFFPVYPQGWDKLTAQIVRGQANIAGSAAAGAVAATGVPKAGGR